MAGDSAPGSFPAPPPATTPAPARVLAPAPLSSSALLSPPAPVAGPLAGPALDNAAATATSSTGRKGQGRKKGKGPARGTKPPVGGAAIPAAASTSAAAPPSPAVPFTGSESASSRAPRAYAQVAAAPPRTAAPSAPTAASGPVSGGLGPFPSLTRRHGVCCHLVPASPHIETYVRALARVVGPTAIVAASKMYGKAVFFLASVAAAQEAVEKGLAVGGVFVPLEPLEDLGVRVVLTSVPPYLPNAALLPALSAMGKPISILNPLSLGCKDPTLRHILSFRRQVQLQLPPAAGAGAVLEGSFLVPYQGAHYRVHYSTGEARCFHCRAPGHVRRDCPLARSDRASETPGARAGAGPIVADDPSGSATAAAATPPPFAVTPALAAETAERAGLAVADPGSAGHVEERAGRLLPATGRGPPQGEVSPLPGGPLPLPPRAELLPLPSDPAPADQPSTSSSTSGGWVTVRGKRRAHRSQALSLPSDEEGELNPRKMLRGAAVAGSGNAPPDGAQQEALAMETVDAVAAAGEPSVPIVEPPPEVASVAVPQVLASSVPPAATADAGAAFVPVTDEEVAGAGGSAFAFFFDEIEALGLTPVTQGEDNLPSAGPDPGVDLVPPPPPTPGSATPGLVLGEPLALPASPAATTVSCTAAEPLGATAVATQPVLAPDPALSTLPALPASPAAPTVSCTAAEPLGATAVAEQPVFAPDPAPSTLPAPEASPVPAAPVGLAAGEGEPIPVPGPTPSSVQLPVFVPEVSFPATSGPPATPGVVAFPLPTDDPRGAAFVFPLPATVGAVLFSQPPSPLPGLGTSSPAQQRRGSAPCLSVREDPSGALPEVGGGSAAASPSALRDELRLFLSDFRGSQGKVPMALRRWGDFHLVLRAVRALLGEGRGSDRRDFAAYRRARRFCDSLLAFGVEHGILRGPLEAVDPSASEDLPQPSA
ncbi:nascent polypeptide-associated complex subunit alpha, muscle-specific form-like [Emys orbicularis]|uniref:nascent polypeptide-associated complex subunit alpha, muscle-specific form-like n=1 Tax=Emys orbicularis TaxID=82168 RepID=UPI0031FD365B